MLIFVTLFAEESAKAQSIVPNEFKSFTSQISKQTQNSYRLIRLGSNKVPSILSSTTFNQRSIPELQRNDISSVQIFARNEAEFIAKNALTLPATASLVEKGTNLTGNLWLSSYSVSYGEILLRERYLHLNIGALSGKVMLVRNNIPSKQPNTLSATVNASDILNQTTDLLGSHTLISSQPHLVLVDQKESTSLLLCYELIAKDPNMSEIWRLTFDATTGELIEKKSLVENEIGYSENVQSHSTENKEVNMYSNTGLADNPVVSHDAPLKGIGGYVFAKVHLHNPFDTLTTLGLPFAKLKVNGISVETDSTGFWTSPSQSYPLTIQMSFDAHYFTILRQDGKTNSTVTKTISSGNVDILWDDSNSDPTERDAYYSASYAHLVDKRIDEKLTNLDFHMKVNINLNSSCNAFYTPGDTSLNFFSSGGGCSNTGEISDVVFHEYGHRVTNARYQQAAGHDANIVDGSLGEGFADLNSAFIRDDPRIGIGFFGNNNQTIRSCENQRKWPKDISPDIHVSGEIISGAFWDLRQLIGHDATQHLFHFMEYQMPDGNGLTDSASLEDAFTSTLSATILTDDNDNDLSNGTPHLNEILAAFKSHNITLSHFIEVNPSQVKDQDTSASSYNINVGASYHGLVGELEDESIKLHYSIDNGKTYKSLSLKSTPTEGEFTGVIPKVPSGTIVLYYASAASNLSENDTVLNPSPQAPYSFLVGFRKIISDDAEKDRGWSLNSSSDQATTGLWVREKPHGTFGDPTPPLQYIQQDTDHSEIGTMCYITGNHVDPSGNNSPGYDDVDNGATTLTTPAYDLSNLRSPVIRYWYYYSNDQGQNPNISKWQADISNDNGATWKNLQLTNQSTKGWTEFVFKLNDYLPTSSAIKIRFIASDFIQTLVEAGVDDLDISDPIQLQNNSVNIAGSDLQSPYPNPIHRGEKLHIGSNGLKDFHPILIDLLGREVPLSLDENIGITIPLNISPGIYLVEFGGEKCKVIVLE